MATSICGLMSVHWNESVTPFMRSVANESSGKPVRPPPSSTARARKARKKALWGKRRDSCKIVASIDLQLTELRMQKPHDNSKARPAAFYAG
jgi:hypothetical protein